LKQKQKIFFYPERIAIPIMGGLVIGWVLWHLKPFVGLMAGIMSSLAICLAMTPSPSQKEGEEDK
jgi:hypothetical protein